MVGSMMAGLVTAGLGLYFQADIRGMIVISATVLLVTIVNMFED